MPRERMTELPCAEDGCPKSAGYTYTSQREYHQIWARQKTHPWKCTRHNRPEQVLRPDNPTTETVLVASRVRSGGRDPDLLPGLFWLPEGAERGGSGLQRGPGFTAHADDFPEGTRLVVSTRIEMPATTTVDGAA